MKHLLIAAIAALVILADTSFGFAAEARRAYTSVLIEDVPHVRQKPDFCGEACAEMFLTKLGQRMDQDFVFDQSGLNPLAGRGCYTRELITALRRIGFQTGSGWHGVAASDADRQLDDLFAGLHADLLANVPSIVCMHYNDQPNTTEHFRLILGYDARTDEVIYHEPAVRNAAYQRMKRDVLLKLWPLKYDAEQWTVIRLPLKPGRLISGESSTTFTDADYAQHVRRLRVRLAQFEETRQEQVRLAEIELKQWEAERKAFEAEREAKRKAREAAGMPPGEDDQPKLRPRPKRRVMPPADFHIVLQKPFVVVGNETPRMVERRAAGTVDWAVNLLKQDYFSQDPDEIIDIWLFGDEDVYDTYTRQLTGSYPGTPFGFYTPRHDALIMNISTGGGTLVHEIVHPFIASNFPECPSWFNEGLASLYEQCEAQSGHIRGNTNWRLHGLHEAIKDERVPSFETLCGTTTREFYNEDPGTNYSQARYLCYYLQERGLLVKYYHEFRRNVQDDPTGYKTLQKLVGGDDMDEFKKKWEEYVLTLRF